MQVGLGASSVVFSVVMRRNGPRTYKCIHIHIHTYIYVYIYTHIYIYVYILFMLIQFHTVPVYTHEDTATCLDWCGHVYIYIHMYTYVDTVPTY